MYWKANAKLFTNNDCTIDWSTAGRLWNCLVQHFAFCHFVFSSFGTGYFHFILLPRFWR